MNRLLEIWHDFWNGGDEAHEVCVRHGYRSEKGHVEQRVNGQFVWMVDVPATDLSQSLGKVQKSS